MRENVGLAWIWITENFKLKPNTLIGAAWDVEYFLEEAEINQKTCGLLKCHLFQHLFNNIWTNFLSSETALC